MADEDDTPDGPGPIQAKYRESDGIQVRQNVYRTNEGLVVLASPQDIKRLEISTRAQAHIDRTRRYAMPAASLDLPPGFKSEDE